MNHTRPRLASSRKTKVAAARRAIESGIAPVRPSARVSARGAPLGLGDEVLQGPAAADEAPVVVAPRDALQGARLAEEGPLHAAGVRLLLADALARHVAGERCRARRVADRVV